MGSCAQLTWLQKRTSHPCVESAHCGDWGRPCVFLTTEARASYTYRESWMDDQRSCLTSFGESYQMNTVACVDTSLLTDQAECNHTIHACAFQIPGEKTQSLFLVNAVPAVKLSLWQVHAPSKPGRTSAFLVGIARERAGTELQIVSIPCSMLSLNEDSPNSRLTLRLNSLSQSAFALW